MKSAHQEQAAYKTEDLTRTKQIWIGAVSTCVLKLSLNKKPRFRTSKQLRTICSHFSCLKRDRQ